MKRREFIRLVGGATIWPIVARAQSAMPIIGFLNGQSPVNYELYVTSFKDGLKEQGYIVGENVSIEFRWADEQYQRLPNLADELVRLGVNVIVANAPAAFAAKNATTNIPIIFNAGFDPVKAGLVASLNNPGGNVTGVTMLGPQLGPKRLELMHALKPEATQFAFLLNPTGSNAPTQLEDVVVAAHDLGLKLRTLKAANDPDLDQALTECAAMNVGGLIIAGDAYYNRRSQRLAELALKNGVAAIYQYREFVSSGGLLSYGTSLTDGFRLVGNYAARVLKGEKPAALPVQQSTKVELFINLKTAKALGVTMPLSLLGRADEVIE
jgi:putative ABC transport system substrate-binding protein